LSPYVENADLSHAQSDVIFSASCCDEDLGRSDDGELGRDGHFVVVAASSSASGMVPR
jgi:hypothetical protein